MASARIEPRLRDRLAEIEARGPSTPRPQVPVLIEPQAPVEAEAQGDPARSLEDLDRRVSQASATIRGRLAEMGAAEVHQLALANAVAASLTPEQIAVMAGLPDVRLIRLAEEEHVLTR